MLRCFAIRVLSSDSRAQRDMEVIRSSISFLVSRFYWYRGFTGMDALVPPLGRLYNTD